MPQSSLTAVYPHLAIEGARVSLVGSGFVIDRPSLPVVTVNGHPARVVFASATRLDVVIPPVRIDGTADLRVEGADGAGSLTIGSIAVTGLHQVDSPVVDRRGNLYVTYSGTRGQTVPVSIFRVAPGGTRDAFSSSIVNPTSMAFDDQGRLYVSSRFEGTVYRVAEDGSAESFATDLGVACGLAFAPDGTLFVGDRSGTIFSVDQKGRSTAFATLPSSVAAFHLALGSDALFVTGPTLSSNDPVYRITLDGRISEVSRAFGRPQGLTVDAHGRLFVVDALAGASGLYRVDADTGERTLVVAGTGLIGVTFDRSGGMVICSSETAYRLPAAA